MRLVASDNDFDLKSTFTIIQDESEEAKDENGNTKRSSHCEDFFPRAMRRVTL